MAQLELPTSHLFFYRNLLCLACSTQILSPPSNLLDHVEGSTRQLFQDEIAWSQDAFYAPLTWYNEE